MGPYNSFSSSRLDAIHVCRGLAALSVCLLHISSATAFVFPRSVQTVASIGRYGVPVFFVISGFVVPYSLLDRHYKIQAFPRFLTRRIVRLDPPYLVTLALALLLALLGHTYTYRTSDVALHLGYLSGLVGRPWAVSVFWTLGIEFQDYILVGLVLALVLPRAGWLTTPRTRGPILLGLIVAWFFLLSELERRLHLRFTDAQMGGLWLLYKTPFLIGLAALVVRRHALSPVWLVPIGVVSVPLLFVAVLFAWGPGQWPWTGRGLGRILIGLGSISYSLYLTHELVAGRLVAWLQRHGRMPTGALGAWVVVVAEVLICVTVAIGLWAGVERPAVRWSRRLR